MTWINVPFPPRLAFGLECNAMWEADIAVTRAGHESRNLNWEDARHDFNAAFTIRTVDDYQEIRSHFHMARGIVNSWPLLDPSDSRVTIAQGVAVEGEGSDAGSFQLFKRYGAGPFAYDRKITRPFAVQIYFSDVLQAVTADYDIDLDTGVIVPVVPGVLEDDITWSGRFYVPCRYDTKKLPGTISNKSNGELLIDASDIPIVEVKE